MRRGARIRIVERDAELQALSAFMDALPQGPAALLIEGEPGIGKSTLWRAGIELGATRGYRIVASTPGPPDRDLPFACLGDLLRVPLQEILLAMPEPQQRALRVALLLEDPGGPPADQITLNVAALTALRLLAQAGPLLLAIDDAQWVDPPSARVIQFVARRAEHMAIGMLITRRTSEAQGFAQGLAGAFPDERQERLELTGLRLEGIDRILRSRLGAVFLRPTLVQLRDVSGGNPFFALEVGRALLRRGRPPRPGEPLPVPGTLRELLDDRLADLGEATREGLIAAAALAEPTVELVGAVVPGAAAVLANAEDTGVATIQDGRVRFTHPLLASTIYAEAGSEQRARLHGKLAGFVEDPVERARHLGLSTTVPDSQTASVLEHAAKEASARGAPESAAALAERAMSLTPQGEREIGLRRKIDAADYHLQAGDSDRARVLLDETLAEPLVGGARARALHRLGKIVSGQDAMGPAVAILEEALSEHPDDPALRIAILADLVLFILQSGSLERARSHTDEILALARETRDPKALATALTDLAMAEFLLGNGLRADLLKQATSALEDAASADVASILDPELVLGVTLKWSDDFESARSHLEACLRRASERHDEPALVITQFHMGELECWAGNWALAEHHAAAASVSASQSGLPTLENFAMYLRAWVEGHRGREAARGMAERGLAAAERYDDLRGVLRYLALMGFLQLSRGDAEAAHGHFARAAELATGAGYNDPGVLKFRGDEVEAFVALGRLEEAAARLEWLEERGRTLHRPWALAVGARCRGLVHAARGELDEAVAALEQALGPHERLSQPFELGRTLLVLGGVQRRRRQKRTARESLRRALDVFEQLGASLWADRARTELARIGGRAPAPLQLTPTEERVASLAATGRTNREIAAALFISVKTVERHMSHVLGKLGLSSRRDLGRQLASRLGQEPEEGGHPRSRT